MLGEALIIVPKKNNSGASIRKVRDTAIEAIIAAFGGCTVTEGRGYWKDDTGKLYAEPVWKLTTACEPGNENHEDAIQLVGYSVLTLGDQKSVYIRQADGRVQFLSATDLKTTTSLEG